MDVEQSRATAERAKSLTCMRWLSTWSSLPDTSPADTMRRDFDLRKSSATHLNNIPSVLMLRLKSRSLRWADFVIWQYALWWYRMPAIKKGWVDRVCTYGGCTQREGDTIQGVFGVSARSFPSRPAAAETTYQHNGRNADIELIMWPVRRR
jgi:hypothetical protein